MFYSCDENGKNLYIIYLYNFLFNFFIFNILLYLISYRIINIYTLFK